MCRWLDPDATHADHECREEPTRPSVHLQLHGAPETYLVRLAGDLDARARLAAERILAQLAELPPPACLVLDLRAVTSVDADGLVLLERVRRRVQERSGRLSLAGCSPAIRRALEATRLIYFHRFTAREGSRVERRA